MSKQVKGTSSSDFGWAYLFQIRIQKKSGTSDNPFPTKLKF